MKYTLYNEGMVQFVTNNTYFALRANCRSLGHTHASLDVLGAVLPLRLGLDVLDDDVGVADTFFWVIPGVMHTGPVSLPLCEEPPVGLVAALRDLIEVIPLSLVALYILSTDALWTNKKYIFL